VAAAVWLLVVVVLVLVLFVVGEGEAAPESSASWSFFAPLSLWNKPWMTASVRASKTSISCRLEDDSCRCLHPYNTVPTSSVLIALVRRGQRSNKNVSHCARAALRVSE